MPLSDKTYRSELSYTGSPLATDVSSTDWTVIEIPISDWDRFSHDWSYGAFTGEAIVAEWLTITVGASAYLGSSTLYLKLVSAAGMQLSPDISIALDVSMWSRNMNTVQQAVVFPGQNNCVTLWAKTNAGTLNIDYLELTYSPK